MSHRLLAAALVLGAWALVIQVKAEPLHSVEHARRFGADAPGYNRTILEAIDHVQASAPDGGGYFLGVKADPPESPIGYPLNLLGRPLLVPPRRTSYCSGSSYAVFIEAMNRISTGWFSIPYLSEERLECLRMQEPDGSRREDGVKAWGWWNADGFGNHYALVQYLKMGEVVSPVEARAGDFLNLNWKSGLGHSVVFLGYSRDDQGKLQLTFFSSQSRTNGLGDLTVPAELIKDVKFVRLTRPQALTTFSVDASVDTQVAGDTLDF